MGSQKSSESTSYSGSGQSWAKPIAKDAANMITGTFKAAQPYADRALAGTEGVAKNLTNQYDSNSATGAAANQYYGDVLGGKYMQGNPYIDQMAGQARTNIANDVNSQFSMGGRYGSDAHAGALTREMANAENQLRYNDYNSQMGRMDNAAAAGMANTNASGQLALGAYNQQGTLPYAGMQAYAGSLGNLFNGGTQKSVSYAPNPIWGALGAGLGALGSVYQGAGSDIRLKHKIVEVGKLPNGLDVFDFVYKNDPEQATYRGVMAQQVKELLPEAYIENYNGTGYAGVNYALVGMPMMKLNEGVRD